MEINVSGDMVKIGSKFGGDGVNIKRCVGVFYVR